MSASGLRVLVLGNSNTRTAGDRHVTWPEHVRRDVLAQAGVALETTDRPFYAEAPGAAEYARRQVERFQPQIVIVAASCVAVAAPMASVRLKERFGRAADPVIRVGEMVDRLLLGGGHPGRTAYIALHRAVQRVVGVAPTTTLEELVSSYRETFRVLARAEGLRQVVVASTTQYGKNARRRFPASTGIVVAFNEEVRKAATAQHFAWADRDRALDGDGHPGREACIDVDGIHMTDLGQRRMANGVLEALLPVLGSAKDPA